MIFRFAHSHPFEGSKVEVTDDGREHGACQILFSDGVSPLGLCLRNDDGYVLEVPGFTTERGTYVAGREWSVIQDSQGNWRARTE